MRLRREVFRSWQVRSREFIEGGAVLSLGASDSTQTTDKAQGIFLESVHFGLWELVWALWASSSILDENDMREGKSDQVWLAKKREIKTRDDVIDFAQDAHGA
jgi:hypothetical protein